MMESEEGLDQRLDQLQVEEEETTTSNQEQSGEQPGSGDSTSETGSAASTSSQPANQQQQTDTIVESGTEKKGEAEQTVAVSTPAKSAPSQDKEKKKVAKVEVRLQATGDAPIMKQKNYKVEGDKQISWIIAFVRKYLKLDERESLFLYVSQAFSPSLDQTVSNLADCFGSENKLVLYYSKNQAWG